MAPADPDQGKGKGRIVGLAEKLVALGQAGHTVKIVQVMVGGPRAEVVVEPRERPVPAPADLEQSPKNAAGTMSSRLSRSALAT